MIENYDSVNVFVGVDVGKGEHHAVALDRAGTVVFDHVLPNDEGKMRTVWRKLKQHGTVLVVVDQPGHDWRLADRRFDCGRGPGGLSTGPGDAAHRRPPRRGGQDRRPGRDHHRAIRPDSAARIAIHPVADESVAELSMLCGLTTTSLAR